MRIVLAGHLGQLATDFKSVLAGEELILTEQEDMPLEDAAAVLRFVTASGAHLIINCAAYNRVDEAEEHPQPAYAANTFGVRNLALAARECDIPMVHFSTDYVFDGPGRTPYTEDDRPSPKSVYGVSKLSGELMLEATWEKHYIFRVCGLYGYAGSRDKGSNFVETMLALAERGTPVRVVSDQVLTPTPTLTVARAVAEIVRAHGPFGLYHLTSEGACSWYEFARAIFELSELEVELQPVPSDAFPTRARRPRYSVLDNRNLRRAGFAELPPWRDDLAAYLQGRPAARRR